MDYHKKIFKEQRKKALKNKLAKRRREQTINNKETSKKLSLLTDNVDFNSHFSFFDEQQNLDHITNSGLISAAFTQKSNIIITKSRNKLRRYRIDNINQFEEEFLEEESDSNCELNIDYKDQLWILTNSKLRCRKVHDFQDIIFEIEEQDFCCPSLENNSTILPKTQNHNSGPSERRSIIVGKNIYILGKSNTLYIINIKTGLLTHQIEEISIIPGTHKKLMKFKDDNVLIVTFNIDSIVIESVVNVLKKSIKRDISTFKFESVGKIWDLCFLNNYEFLIFISEYWIGALDTVGFKLISIFRRIVGSNKKGAALPTEKGQNIEQERRVLLNAGQSHVIQYGKDHYQVLSFCRKRLMFKSVSKDLSIKKFTVGGRGKLVISPDNSLVLITDNDFKTTFRKFGVVAKKDLQVNKQT